MKPLEGTDEEKAEACALLVGIVMLRSIGAKIPFVAADGSVEQALTILKSTPEGGVPKVRNAIGWLVCEQFQGTLTDVPNVPN